MIFILGCDGSSSSVLGCEDCSALEGCTDCDEETMSGCEEATNLLIDGCGGCMSEDFTGMAINDSNDLNQTNNK